MLIILIYFKQASVSVVFNIYFRLRVNIVIGFVFAFALIFLTIFVEIKYCYECSSFQLKLKAHA